MPEGTVKVFIIVVLGEGDPDEMIDILTRMGYEPHQFKFSDNTRAYSADMYEDDVIMLKLLSISGAQIQIIQ